MSRPPLAPDSSRPPNRKIAFIGSARYRSAAAQSGFLEYDLLRHEFARHGITLEMVEAYDPAVRWADFAAALPLGFWGYYKDPDTFSSWLDALTQKGVRVHNPPSVLRWNMEKTYLLDLQRVGVQVAELRHFPVGSQPDLAAVLAAAGWERYVVKPTRSANAENTLVGTGVPNSEVRTLAASILARCGLLVQPFFPEIPEDGEWSLIVAGGQLSHAVKKRPKAGDFRSQPDHGGKVLHEKPTAEVAAQAIETVRLASTIVGPLTYARVDGFVRNNRLHLIELELIEPYLFLQGQEPQVARRLVDSFVPSLR